MRDSGVAWLGEVPEHWGVARLSTLVAVIKGYPFDSEFFVKGGSGFPLIRIRDLYSATTAVNYTGPVVDDAIVRKGEIIVGMDGDFNVARWRGPPALLNQRMCCLRAKQSSIPGFTNRVVGLPLKEIADRTPSTTVKHLSSSQIRKIYVGVPPLPEQRAIARFLDHMDRRIQKYIRAKEKLIALLDEYKQALIHQAVTGQIDVRTGRPYEEYKESGVGWLGKIPSHWSVRRNGRLFVERNERGFGHLPILEVSLRTGVHIRDMEAGARKQQVNDRDSYKRAAQGDIAYNMMRMWQGAVGVAPVAGLISPAYVVARPLDEVAPRYYEYLFRTTEYKRQVNMESRGIVPDRNRLYWDQFKQMSAMFPPPEDQKRIAHFLDTQAKMIALAVQNYGRLIDVVGEFRKALIGQVVTGKLDVREAAASLPDLDPIGDDSASNPLNAPDSCGLDEATAVA